MKTLEIIKHINGNGGLNLNHLRWCAKQDGEHFSVWLRGYIKGYFGCSRYVAEKVTNHYTA